MAKPKVHWRSVDTLPPKFVLLWLWDTLWAGPTLGWYREGNDWAHYSGDGNVKPSHWAELEWPDGP